MIRSMGLLGLLFSSALCAKVVHNIDWNQFHPIVGDVVEVEGTTALRIDRNSKAMILVLDMPTDQVSQPVLALRGEVRYQGLEQDFLEMWVTFNDGGRYFSRTQAEQGPMASMHGDSDWRPILVPFTSQGTNLTPVRIELFVTPPAPGILWISNLELVEAANWQALLRDVSDLKEPASGDARPPTDSAWWGNREAGWIGASVGVSLGILGAVLGLLAAKGLARSAVLGIASAVSAVGFMLLATGIYAWVSDQPYPVWFGLVLGGGIGVLVGLYGRFAYGRAYTAHELRRMRARDAS